MSAIPTKQCEQCKESYTPSKYTVNRQRFCSVRCGQRNHEQQNREMHAEKSRRWRAKNPERLAEVQRRALLKAKYGLTPDDYDRMLEEQGGCCAICRKPTERAATREGGYLCVDHDHVTGAVRGLLCGHCNAVLGYGQDSPAILRMALHYLEETTYAPAVD